MFRKRTMSVFLLSVLAVSGLTFAQGDEAKEPDAKADAADKVVIADEPRTVDPANLVPKFLGQPKSVNFENSSLREVVQWLQDNEKVPVLIDNRSLTREGISLGEPISDQLVESPVYLLLNRLRSIGIGWYVSDDILHITTLNANETRMSTEPYNVGDLFDAGYKPEDVSDVIQNATQDNWIESGGEGGIELLGDVIFVRNTDAQHREVQGLLTALRKHGRQTYAFDPPEHIQLRAKLELPASVNFSEAPLVTAVASLAKMTGADIRLDGPALREIGIRDREPISLKLADRSLGTVLQVLLADLELTTVLRDGVLWVTSEEEASMLLKTAVYDVRDLCRNQDEADALSEAILNQTAGPWLDMEGEGGTITLPRPGVLVVRQTERGLAEVLNLLQNYRLAATASKIRDRAQDKQKEVTTRYYRMTTDIAVDLEAQLPSIVAPKSWVKAKEKDAVGSIRRISSRPDYQQNHIVENSVLIIKQTKEVHDLIADVITRIQSGDPLISAEGGGFGGGGFGGGLFDVPSKQTRRKK